jgi:DNA-binding SARP family transcriptional activator
VSRDFGILGPVQIHLDDGRRAPVPRGRVLSLLALLLVHRDETVHADRIVDELWGGRELRNAKNAVQVVASRLRAVVGDGALAAEGGGYALRVPPGAVDADRFEDRLARGAEQLAHGRPRQAAATLKDALGLWRGPPLVDVCDESFAQPEIARLDDVRLTCLGKRLDADLACGRHAELTGELEALVRQHPLRERLRGQLMIALYRAGRQADALAAYRAAREALVDGLGIEPSPELRALEAAILRHDLPAAAARRVTWSFHGLPRARAHTHISAHQFPEPGGRAWLSAICSE